MRYHAGMEPVSPEYFIDIDGRMYEVLCLIALTAYLPEYPCAAKTKNSSLELLRKQVKCASRCNCSENF